MNGQTQKSAQLSAGSGETSVRHSSLLARLRARRRARLLERLHWEHDQRYAWFVQDVFAACGLAQQDSSIAGGRTVHVPHVIEVTHGPPVSVDVRILPGQLPKDFAAQAEVIAYDLEVSDVRVIPLAPSLIRLELLP